MKKNYTVMSFGLVLLITSCSTFNHSYRVSNIPDQDIKVADKIGVELKIDLNRVIRATSEKQPSIMDAKEEAYYKAIVDNQIHVLVDPIYSVETSAHFLIFGGKSRASVIGFAGYYTNPKSIKVIEAEKKAAKVANEQAAYERTIKEMELLAKNKIIGSRNTESSELACFSSCGSGDNAINAIEVTRTSIKTSLVDEYLAFKKSLDSPSLTSDEESSSPIILTDLNTPVSSDVIKTSSLGKIAGKLKSVFKKKKK
jgi:hypothetical protein